MTDFLNIPFSTYQNILYGWIAIAIIVFFILLKITAPYGRHVKKGWGPEINNRLAWVLMEVPVLSLFLFFVLSSASRQTSVTWIMIGLFSLHYFNRIFVFPFRIHTKGKSMPVIIVASAIFFNLMNGFSLGYYFSHYADYPDNWFLDGRFIIGLVLFIAGMAINWKADDVLIHLRKPNETHYVIPQSKLFRYISCPNLFGELVEWLGFAILCWNLPALTFFIWTAANLIPRAISHHKWYIQKFPNYPTSRKAIIPKVI